MKKWISVLATVTLMITTSFAYADTLKIGFVDLNQILQKSPLMISLNETLTKKFKSRQDEINNASKQLQDEVNQLTYSNTTMSMEERNNLQNKITEDKANLQILTTSLQKDLELAKNKSLQTFMTKFTSVINKIAQDGQYDLIQQSSNILYLNNKLDITQQVLPLVK